jgi:hypothetical protein
MLKMPLMPTPHKETSMLPQDAKLMAQFVAMAPFVFQTAVCLRDFGILQQLLTAPDGLTISEIQNDCTLDRSSLSILLDAGESAGLVAEKAEIYRLTQVGELIETDPITRVNMNFSQDVCYQGLFNLKESLQTKKPVGLKVFGPWATLYEGLSSLPEKVKKSWLDFDHFFSDDCFPRAHSIVEKVNPQKILDVGGNTGKFASLCVKNSSSVNVTIADHPGQINMAQTRLAQIPGSDRIKFCPTDLLDRSQSLPTGHDVIWMSQLLSCFAEDEIVMLLQKARKALAPGGSLFIMETFTDNQKFSVSRFCLDMTSLYFTAMANGNSRMYRSRQFYPLVKAAEFRIVDEYPHVRLNHTVIRCQI